MIASFTYQAELNDLIFYLKSSIVISVFFLFLTSLVDVIVMVMMVVA